MGDTSGFQKCCFPGCGFEVPTELGSDLLCVAHFLLDAESVCTGYRRETIPGGADAPRRIEIQNYVAASAMKLARLGTGSARLSDEMKKRILTTFLTLMILRENVDRTSGFFQPRQKLGRSGTPAAHAAA